MIKAAFLNPQIVNYLRLVIKELQTKILIITLKVIVFSSIIFSQNIDSINYSKLYPFVVDSIRIIGNKTTEEFIILQEINFSIGDTLTEQSAHYNRERVYSLGIFNKVFLYLLLLIRKGF